MALAVFLATAPCVMAACAAKCARVLARRGESRGKLAGGSCIRARGGFALVLGARVKK